MATVTQNKALQEYCSCPYWSPFTCCCLLVKDDLFIPLQHHVVMYCLSSRFAWCSYYVQLAGFENQTEPEQEHSINHRRSIRTSRYNRFSYAEIVDNHLFKNGTDTTWTFDLSEHGIRFASDQLLEPETAIHFCVEDEETFTTMKGVGKVVWCTPLKSTSFFQVGVAITWLFD